MILGGGLLVGPEGVRRADLRVADGRIAEIGADLQGEGRVELHGAWVAPGFVCAHHHLYSALATGMPFLPGAPTSFTDLLQRVWWRLDRALDLDSVEVCGLVGGVDALRCGVTTIVDHHASPSAIAGSLGVLDDALGAVGVRRVLAYEVTDRNGLDGTRAGLLETGRQLGRGASSMSATMVGAHAAFTLSDRSIRACADLARDAGVGLHIHVAEAVDDPGPVRRLAALDALVPGSILAHGVHLDAEELALAQGAGAWFTHQPRSNMNNGVGYAPIAAMGERLALGTDGIGADMLAELQAGYFRSQEARVGWGPDRWSAVLDAGHRLVVEKLGVTTGRLAVGAAADLVVFDPAPGPPLTAENAAAARVFRMGAHLVRDVMVAGAWRLRDRQPTGVDAAALDRRAQVAAAALWSRME